MATLPSGKPDFIYNLGSTRSTASRRPLELSSANSIFLRPTRESGKCKRPLVAFYFGASAPPVRKTNLPLPADWDLFGCAASEVTVFKVRQIREDWIGGIKLREIL